MDKDIPLTPVTSSNIAAIGYDKDSKTLAVQFKNGALWHYSGVSEAAHKSLMDAPSKGSYFAAQVKPRYRASQQPAKK